MRGDWIDIAAAEQLTSTPHLDAEIDGYRVTIVRLAGDLYAFEDRCTHDGESLADAEIEAGSATGPPVVVCPRHGARFCLRHGTALTPPAYEPVKIFAVRERGGRIEVQSP